MLLLIFYKVPRNKILIQIKKIASRTIVAKDNNFLARSCKSQKKNINSKSQITCHREQAQDSLCHIAKLSGKSHSLSQKDLKTHIKIRNIF